jgi:hypothetical protein
LPVDGIFRAEPGGDVVRLRLKNRPIGADVAETKQIPNRGKFLFEIKSANF